MDNVRDEILEKRFKDLRDILEIQGQEGNWNYDNYMLGLYNGLELGLATMEGRSPVYRSFEKVEE